MKKLLRIIYIIFIILFLFTDSILLTKVFHHILLNLVLSCFILKNYKRVDKKEKIISIILSILLFIMLSYRGVLSSDFYIKSTNKIMFYTILPLVLLSSLYINVSFIIQNRKKILINSSEPDEKLEKKIFYVFIILAFLSCFSSFKYKDYNDTGRLINYLNWGELNEWYTLTWQLIVSLIWKITYFKLSLPIQIFNTFIYLISFKYTLNIINKHLGKKALIIFTIISSIFFQPILYLQLSYKDVLFSNALLGFTTGLFDIIKSNKISKKTIFLTTLFAFFVSNVRHMGVFPIVVELIVLIIYLYKNEYKRNILIRITTLTVALFMMINIVLVGLLNVTRVPSYVKYTVPIYIVYSFANDEYEFNEYDKSLINKYYPIEEAKEKFEIYNADCVSRKWRIKDNVHNLDMYDLKDDFIRINFDLFIHHPIRYVKYLFRLNTVVYEIASPRGNDLLNLLTTERVDDTHIEDYMYISVLHEYFYNFEDHLMKTPILGDFYFRGGFYTFIYFLYIFINIIDKERKRTIYIISLIVINLFFIVSIPSEETRYILPMITLLPLITILTFENREKTNSN